MLMEEEEDLVKRQLHNVDCGAVDTFFFCLVDFYYSSSSRIWILVKYIDVWKVAIGIFDRESVSKSDTRIEVV